MVTAYLRRAYSSFATSVLDRPSRLLSFLFFLLLLVVPLSKPGPRLLGMLVMVHIMAIFAASWDLLVGRAGQISLGHALFFAIGGYSSVMLFRFFKLPIWVTIPIGVLVSVLVALLLGFPCVRVKGPYLALVTMAFPAILSTVFTALPLGWFGKDTGFRAPAIFPIIPYTYSQQKVLEYYLSLLILFMSAIILYKVATSKTGIVFISILDDEQASKACGINVTKHKLLAFAISALFGSLAGCFFGHLQSISGYVNTGMLSLTMSFLPVMITIIGGIGTIYGPIVGAYIYYFVSNYIIGTYVKIPPLWMPIKEFIFIIFLIIIILKWPRGLGTFVPDKLEDLQEAREIEERGKYIWKTYRKKK